MTNLTLVAVRLADTLRGLPRLAAKKAIFYVGDAILGAAEDYVNKRLPR